MQFRAVYPFLKHFLDNCLIIDDCVWLALYLGFIDSCNLLLTVWLLDYL